jgi:hypothetical protein
MSPPSNNYPVVLTAFAHDPRSRDACTSVQ